MDFLLWLSELMNTKVIKSVISPSLMIFCLKSLHQNVEKEETKMSNFTISLGLFLLAYSITKFCYVDQAEISSSDQALHYIG